MKLRTTSNTPKTFTFNYDFQDIDTAQTAGSAIIGYMVGTYENPKIELTYQDRGSLIAEYTEDKSLTKNFKRICDTFNDSTNSQKIVII